MKKYIIVTLCTISPLLYSMEEPTVQTRTWDAQAYDQGSQLQATAFLHFINKNNINVKNKTILDVGCGTGRNTAQFAEEATHIHGIDANKDLINYAQSHRSTTKL